MPSQMRRSAQPYCFLRLVITRTKLLFSVLLIIPHPLLNSKPGQPVVRAILGGTGKYMGARGQLASTRNGDGSYTQVFTLLK